MQMFCGCWELTNISFPNPPLNVLKIIAVGLPVLYFLSQYILNEYVFLMNAS